MPTDTPANAATSAMPARRGAAPGPERGVLVSLLIGSAKQETVGPARNLAVVRSATGLDHFEARAYVLSETNGFLNFPGDGAGSIAPLAGPDERRHLAP
ncbi:hypothetical protein Kisp01_60080 [Kineosporia sp. NBRC 101677]|nr:hypothetical protein Kisp01_60080 [Kineosporia sp. NBRC 101677]